VVIENTVERSPIETNIILSTCAGTQGGGGRHIFRNPSLCVEREKESRKNKFCICSKLRDIKKFIAAVCCIFRRTKTSPPRELKDFCSSEKVFKHHISTKTNPEILNGRGKGIKICSDRKKILRG